MLRNSIIFIIYLRTSLQTLTEALENAYIRKFDQFELKSLFVCWIKDNNIRVMTSQAATINRYLKKKDHLLVKHESTK